MQASDVFRAVARFYNGGGNIIWSAEGTSLVGGYGRILPQKIFKFEGSKTLFSALVMHLHERVDGHKQKSSSICKHYLSEHNSVVPPFISAQFHMLTKGSNKFDCLIKEMLFIRKLKPSLNVQAVSIRAKVFI